MMGHICRVTKAISRTIRTNFPFPSHCSSRFLFRLAFCFALYSSVLHLALSLSFMRVCCSTVNSWTRLCFFPFFVLFLSYSLLFSIWVLDKAATLLLASLDSLFPLEPNSFLWASPTCHFSGVDNSEEYLLLINISIMYSSIVFSLSLLPVNLWYATCVKKQWLTYQKRSISNGAKL